MGKLHKIKREIRKNPNRFYSQYSGVSCGVHPFTGLGEIKPHLFGPRLHFKADISSNSYRHFVKKTLRDLGIDVR